MLLCNVLTGCLDEILRVCVVEVVIDVDERTVSMVVTSLGDDRATCFTLMRVALENQKALLVPNSNFTRFIRYLQ